MKGRARLLPALLVAVLPACGRQGAPVATQATGDVAPRADYQAVAQALEPFIEHERQQKDIPALSIALVDGSTVVWAQGFGVADSARSQKATAHTVYRVGSVSKLFTDVAMMQLVEQGKLSLDAPLSRYLPDFHPTNPFGGDITLRELTGHLAGLTREPPVGNYFDDTGPSLAATVASLNGTTLIYAPDTHTKYSNAGIAVLGYVLEKTQGESFYPYVQHAVLDPMGLHDSAFQPLPAFGPRLAKGYMWSIDGLSFEAPTFQLGMGPCGSLYTSVLDLASFEMMLFHRGVAPNGHRILQPQTLDSMWTPQHTRDGASTGYGIGFRLGSLEGHRSVGHDGAIYGFATTLSALPDDSLGVVVVATLDGVNAVTDHIADAALRLMLAKRQGQPTPTPDTTHALPPGEALQLKGRYTSATDPGVDLNEYEGRLFLTPLRGGSRLELRALGDALIADGRLGYGARVTPLAPDRLVVGGDTLTRLTATSPALTTRPEPAAASSRYAGLIGEYGWNYDKLYILERQGKLTALIEWFFEYPLEQVSDSVYRFPDWGLYDGQKIVFRRDASGNVDEAVTATVAFKRLPLPGDNDAVSFRIQPVRPVAELRQAALAAQPPKETGQFRTPDLVELRSLDPTIKYDIRYAGTNNFMGHPFYTSVHAFMQRPAAEAVVRVSHKLRALGYGLLVHDAYRPWYVTKMFWDGTPVDKHIFVADPSQGSRHNRGCAVDITLYDLKTGQPMNMPGGYDEMSQRSYPLYPGGTAHQRWLRNLLRHAMESEGFTVYDFEWWHFDYKDWRSYPIMNITFEQLAERGARPR
jgi:CubicO group peptidase (beta-lactamase class C family)/D-alanyl-D-alanine dipeptidase